MVRKWVPVLLSLLLVGACNRKANQLVANDRAITNKGQTKTTEQGSGSSALKEREVELVDGLYARITSGDRVFLAELYYKTVPLTVTNFAGLAEGKLANSARGQGQPYYDGLSWHRVVPGFVIQGGDPRGDGTGGPGYQFPDEFSPSLQHDSAGVLSMANAGPGTNGSQFFITLAAQPHLNGLHSVFGKVIQGVDQLADIKQGDRIDSIEIVRVGEDARKFDDSQQAFDVLLAKAKEKATRSADQQWKSSLDYARKKWGSHPETEDKSGIVYWITSKGDGEGTPKKSSTVTAHYRLTVVDAQGKGRVIDESYRRGAPFTQPLANLIPGWSVMLTQMSKGEKRAMVIPSQLGYGSRGAPPAIPPNSALVFEVELLEFS